MISVDGVRKSQIRTHYELATLFYRLLWGVHIHHGLWEGDESPRVAQRQLIEHLIQQSDLPRGASVVDIGCGMGGSSIHLAKNHDCTVLGVTLSGVQRRYAQLAAAARGVASRARFKRQDAESLEFDDESFDFLWSVECTEHLFDKPAFFRKAACWIKPGGGVALAVWNAADSPHTPSQITQVQAVCDAFLCPSLGEVDDYSQWLVEAGFDPPVVTDLTANVMRTWRICRERVQRSGVGLLSRLFGRNMIQFVDNFDTIYAAYESGAMKYCTYAAKKKPTRESR